MIRKRDVRSVSSLGGSLRNEGFERRVGGRGGLERSREGGGSGVGSSGRGRGSGRWRLGVRDPETVRLMARRSSRLFGRGDESGVGLGGGERSSRGGTLRDEVLCV